jgi:hypothetical protein
MDFAKQIEYNRRLLVEDIFRRLEAALRPLVDAVNDFFAVLFSRRLPADWREQWHALIAEQEAAGYRVDPKSVQEFEDWIEAWARYCELLPAAETHAVSAAQDANDLLVPKMTTTQTVPRYRNGRIVGGMGGDVAVPGQSLSEAVPIFFEVAVTVSGVFLEPLDWALTAREIWNEPSSGWSYAGLIPVVPAGAGKIGKAIGRVGDEAAEAAIKNAPKRGIYEFPDATAGGKPYVGQSGNISQRLQQQKQAGRLTEGIVPKTTEIPGGRTAREIAEHQRIQEITDGVPARRSPAVSNQRDPIGPNRRHLLDE